MDLRLLEYFVAVAELEHVGKAAQRLNISQSPLSRQIRQLENDLNLELFTRHRQRIRLTSAGSWLLPQAKSLLAHARKVQDEAEQRARGQLGTLSISFTSAAMWSGILPSLLGRFQTAFPNAAVELHNMRTPLQIQAVQSGRIDIGFLSAAPPTSDLAVTCLSEEPCVLVVPCSNALARKRQIQPADLNNARWILLSESPSQEKQDRFFSACKDAGFIPQVVQRVAEPMTLLALVESGLGIGVIRESARKYAPKSVTFRPLPWFSLKLQIYMVRPAGWRHPLSDAFAALLPQPRL